MMPKPLLTLVLVSSISLWGCSQNDSAQPEDKTTSTQPENFGGGLGRGYTDMLNEAKQGAEQANEHMQDTERQIRDSN